MAMTEAGPALTAPTVRPDAIEPSIPTAPFALSSPLSTPPLMPDAGGGLRTSRPLSEISENDQRRRSSARQSVHSIKGEKPSRPPSEVKDDTRRLSAHIATITLNLNDYASVAKRPASAVSSKSRDSLISPVTAAGPSINKIPAKPERPTSYRTTSVSSIKEIQKAEQGSSGSADTAKAAEPDTKEGHPLLMAKRLSLRPSPLGATYAEVAKSEPSSPSVEVKPNPIPNESIVSLNTTSARSSLDSKAKPLPKQKPSWLRRASGTAALRTKSKSPAASDESLISSPSLPPELPPRRRVISTATDALTWGSKSTEPPSKTSYASIAAAAGPSRSRLGDGVGRPAFSPPISSQPSRDNNNIRSRIAAWTSASASQPPPSQSESSKTVASTAPSAFSAAQQRLPSSAQRMIGSAGSAVQKGWAGLRASRMGGSISGLSSIASGSGEGSGRNLEAPRFIRKTSRDRSVSAQATMGAAADGPILHAASILRPATYGIGKVFGRDITEAGKAWGVVEADRDGEGMSVWEKRRRECLPAVIIRAVDYLVIWGPKEEGIFRISGRSSHLNRLRKEFDSGADINMADCHPGDLDPHAVSGLFKSYLRELPTPLLTKDLSPRFEAASGSKPLPSTVDLSAEEPEDLSTLLPLLPIAHWFLLADIIKLLQLIPDHSATNRMTLNALMLSLGPSLNIPGTVLTDLLDRREELFSTPPQVSRRATLMDLIDFGETPAISTTVIDVSRPESRASSSHSADTSLSPPAVEKVRKSPRLPKKPSFSRLLSAAAPILPKREAAESAQSLVPPSPPRVELSTDSPKLPTFETDAEREASEAKELREKALPKQPTPTETPYPTESVLERAKAFSTATPIADLYAGTSTKMSPRSGKSSNGSLRSTASNPVIGLFGSPPSLSTSDGASAITNPATVIRRGQPIFFQSGGNERHGRSTSTNSVPPASVTKKEERGGSAEAEEVIEEGRNAGQESANGASTGAKG